MYDKIVTIEKFIYDPCKRIAPLNIFYKDYQFNPFLIKATYKKKQM